MRLIDADKVIEKLEAFVELSDFGFDELIEVGRFIEFIKNEPAVKQTLTIPVDHTNPIRYKLNDDWWHNPITCEQMEWKFDNENS